VKEAALALGLRIEQPERIRRPEVIQQLAELTPDVIVVVGYGQIIPQTIIDLPRHGIVNVHASLLPKYRGAAPIQWAVANGERITGVTTMLINAGLDTGDMLLKAETPIGDIETAVELSDRLAPVGAALLVATLDAMSNGTAPREPQSDAEASYAPILKKEDGLVDWGRTAVEIDRRRRGFLPWPGAYTTFRGQVLHIWRSKPANDIDSGVPGTVRVAGRRLLVTCGQATSLEIEELQLEGRKRMSAEAFLNGHRPAANDILGEKTN
jgi:methionyl-tRNA formyltransferase